MNNYFVIGNPISHSLSPLIHNHWFRKYRVDSNYEKRKLDEDDLKGFIEEVRRVSQINGANVTVPFKKKIIPFLDELTEISQRTLSVNTIYKEKGKLIGHNTDAKWANILYVGQIPEKDIQLIEKNTRLYNKVKRTIENSGNIEFNNELFTITKIR